MKTMSNFFIIQSNTKCLKHSIGFAQEMFRLVNLDDSSHEIVLKEGETTLGSINISD